MLDIAKMASWYVNLEKADLDGADEMNYVGKNDQWLVVEQGDNR